MTLALTVRDESLTGEQYGEWVLELDESTRMGNQITVRELIEARVLKEAARQNAVGVNREERSRATLVRPERRHPRLARRPIDPEAQVKRAIDGFTRHEMLVLVGDRQADSLDESIDLDTQPEVSFVRLVPLVGG